ncbi:MAG: hypothetical protein H7296_05200 [Bacteroidia bacterium]|nr:hypothetical protein [Bacteroidia bacterium]
MPKIYTEKHLLLFLYNELAAEEVVEMNAELAKNPVLFEQYQHLKSGIAALDSLSEEPSQTSIDLVMEYAQKLAAAEVANV